MVNINEYLTLIDTPGLIDSTSIVNMVDVDLVKKISPKKRIKPHTYQLREGQGIMIGDLVRIDYVEGEKNSFTVFVSNEIKIGRVASTNIRGKDLNKTSYDVKYNNDLVINGLGFIKIVNKGKIDVYVDKNVSVYFRKSLI